ncbi:MAG: metallophosphoesterase [Caldilineaceae bacterium]
MANGNRGLAALLGIAGLGAGVGAALAGYAYLHEPFDVRLDRLALTMPNSRGKLPVGGLRLLHLSDFHFRGAEPREQRKTEEVRRITAGLEYDLLIHTGDFLHYDAGMENVFALLDVLPPPRLGSFAVMGNHDYAVYRMSKAVGYTWRNFVAKESRLGNGLLPHRPSTRQERTRRYLRFALHLLHNRIDGEPSGLNDVPRLRHELERRGIRVLHNSSVRLQADGLDMYLAGVDDLQEGHPDLAAAFAQVGDDAPLLLLSHNPDILQARAAHRADLILAGHTHGGQIVLPFLGPAHTQTDILGRADASGHVHLGDTQLYISRGLGEGIPLRFGAPPHISLITLLPEEEK